MWTRCHTRGEPGEEAPGCWSPPLAVSVRVHSLPSSLPSWRKRGPERASNFPKVTQETVIEASQPSKVSLATPPPHTTTPYALGPSNHSSARGGAHPPTPPPLCCRSVWVSTRTQPCTAPQPPALRKERQAGGRSARPAPHTRSRQTAAPALAPPAPRPPQAGARQPPGQRRVAGWRHSSCSLARSLR